MAGPGFNLPPDFVREYQALVARVERLENRPTNPLPTYTDTTRPPAANVPGLLIRNTTSGTVQWSNGVTWAAL